MKNKTETIAMTLSCKCFKSLKPANPPMIQRDKNDLWRCSRCKKPLKRLDELFKKVTKKPSNYPPGFDTRELD